MAATLAEPPLAGYTVVDLSTGIAGAYCTKLLADGGADVIKVEPPEGDPLRRGRPRVPPSSTGSDGALFSFLACSKHSVVADPGTPTTSNWSAGCWRGGRGGVVAGSEVAEHAGFTPEAIHRATRT